MIVNFGTRARGIEPEQLKKCRQYHSTRFYVQEIDNGAPHPVTPEGTSDGWLSTDGKLVLARGPEGKYFVHPIEGGGGETRPVPGPGPSVLSPAGATHALRSDPVTFVTDTLDAHP
jgi:hypothetical protein